MLQQLENVIQIQSVGKGMVVSIETPRLFIRSYDEQDLDLCVDLYGDPVVTKMFDYGKALTENQVRLLVAEKGRKYFDQGHPFGLYSIFTRRDGLFIGQLDIMPAQEPGAVELGCILHRNFQSQGFGTEALKAVMDDLLREFMKRNLKCGSSPLRKVLATAHPDNLPSNRLIDRLGMKMVKREQRFENPRIWYSYVLGTDNDRTATLATKQVSSELISSTASGG